MIHSIGKDMKTIQYMGSKKNLLDFIDTCIEDYMRIHKAYCQKNSIPFVKCERFFDVFSGSGRVSYYFRNKYRIVSNDKLYFSKVILNAYLCNPYPKSSYHVFVDELNRLQESDFIETDIDWWYSKTYGGEWNQGKSEDSNGVKKLWLMDNAKKIDMIRYQIKKWKNDQRIDSAQENVLLLALILAVNKVSNVVGHQNGYLKNWCSNAQRALILETPNVFQTDPERHEHHVGDIFEQLPFLSGDIAYIDPPYGTNNKNLSVATRYSSFYHLWNTLVQDIRPSVFGKAHKPIQTKGYTEPLEKNKRDVVFPRFLRIIEEIDADYVVFSYSNKSLLTAKDFYKLYELAGCDMNTFCLYIAEHTTNNQTKLAKKEGDWIDRVNDEMPLQEYLFIARKDRKRKNAPNRITKIMGEDYVSSPETEAWISNGEDYRLPEDVCIKWYPKDILIEKKSENSSFSLFDLL